MIPKEFRRLIARRRRLKGCAYFTLDSEKRRRGLITILLNTEVDARSIMRRIESEQTATGHTGLTFLGEGNYFFRRGSFIEWIF